MDNSIMLLCVLQRVERGKDWSSCFSDCTYIQGASIPMGQWEHVPPIFGLVGHYHEYPSPYLRSNRPCSF